MAEGNGYATREMLLGKPAERRYADCVLNGFKFRLRSLSALEANTVQARVIAENDTEDKIHEIVATNCRLIAQCVVNGDGQRIFSDKDVKELLERDAAFINKLAAECQKHAGIDPDEVEDAEKNYVETAT